LYCQLLQESKLFSLGCETTFWQSVWQLAGEPAFRNIGLLVVAVIGVGFAFYRSVKLHQQTKTAIRQAETSEAGLNIDRFHRGTEMLSSNSPYISAAGARMLGGLARNNIKEYYPLVGRILSSYIEEISPAPDFHDYTEQELEEATFLVPPEQCAAVMIELSILNEQRLSKDIFPFEVIKLRKTNLMKIALQAGNFSKAIFSGSEMGRMLLTHSDLSFANFYQCNLRGTNLSHSNLTGAFLLHADLEFAILENTDFRDVDFSGANKLSYAQLSQAKNVDPEFLAKLKAEEEAAAAKAAEENSPT
jgi:hypothetical protein